jgi:hypothetical protein
MSILRSPETRLSILPPVKVYHFVTKDIETNIAARKGLRRFYVEKRVHTRYYRFSRNNLFPE